MGVWRNGSASDFDCHSLSEGCSFEYCHAHSFCGIDFPAYGDVKPSIRPLQESYFAGDLCDMSGPTRSAQRHTSAHFLASGPPHAFKMIFCECSLCSAGFTVIDQCLVYRVLHVPVSNSQVSCPSILSRGSDKKTDSDLGSALISISMDIIRVIEVPCGVGCVIDEGRVWTKPNEWILSGNGSMIFKARFPTSINSAPPPLCLAQTVSTVTRRIHVLELPLFLGCVYQARLWWFFVSGLLSMCRLRPHPL